ncbi:hypothetical protein TWF481_011576 [Arthrobotrys musiformis]|uniref:Uncharacterized protein n=1 Tax=Arthrobotrys musiformis TaxID=47236 RepID=A0AAV9W054_9PEZI
MWRCFKATALKKYSLVKSGIKLPDDAPLAINCEWGRVFRDRPGFYRPKRVITDVQAVELMINVENLFRIKPFTTGDEVDSEDDDETEEEEDVKGKGKEIEEDEEDESGEGEEEDEGEEDGEGEE